MTTKLSTGDSGPCALLVLAIKRVFIPPSVGGRWVMFSLESSKVYFRDKIVPFNDAVISVACTGFLYGLGVFTGIRAHLNVQEGQLYLFRPKDHYRRLVDACRLCSYQNFLTNYSEERFVSVLLQLMRENQIREDVYIRVTNFTDENRITPKFVGYKDSLSVFAYPLGDYVPTSGMRCKVSSWTRIEDNSIPARAKLDGAYVNTAFATAEALKAGCDEAIFLDRNGHVVEGGAENIFLVLDDRVVTPPACDNILEGITRRTVLEILRDEGVQTIERSVDRSELYRAQEIFLTGTGAQVAPVTEVDGVPVGSGGVGVLASKVQSIYAKAVRGEIERYRSWVQAVYD